MPQDEGCICNGNWRSIVRECEPWIGQEFEHQGKRFRFLGVLHGADDYYYAMLGEDHKPHLLSCVSDLEGWDYKLAEARKKE